MTSTPAKRFPRLAIVPMLLWLLFVFYLDIRYDMFPRVLFGGVKILIAVYAAAVVLLWTGRGLRAVWRALASRGH